MKIEQAKQIASKAIEELSHALEAGHSEKLREYLGAMARFHRYSLHNIMLIASQRPDATHVAGFHTWKRLGRFVKKGAKGILILAPVVLREEAESKQKDEKNERAAIRFRAAYVFDMADTDGKPIPQFGSTEGDPSDRTERLKEFLSSRGIQLEYSDAIYPAQGQCSPGKIVILPGQAAPEEFATLVHEVAHALLHQGEQRTRNQQARPRNGSGSGCFCRVRRYRTGSDQLSGLHSPVRRQQGNAGGIARTDSAHERRNSDGGNIDRVTGTVGRPRQRASRLNIPVSANHQKRYLVRAVGNATNTTHRLRQHATKSLELGWKAVAPDNRGGA